MNTRDRAIKFLTIPSDELSRTERVEKMSRFGYHEKTFFALKHSMEAFSLTSLNPQHP
jgi:hypothetical protein